VLGTGPNGGHCGHPGGYCREVPDVSADADPATGYEFYWNGSGGDPGQSRGWQAIGGTSAAAPVWAALMALADASRACAGGAMGMALPALYRAAGSDYPAAFNDVRSGNNDFTGMNGGQFTAGPGYDEASGLGTPNASALVPRLCASALRLLPLGARHSARLARLAALRVRTIDAPQAGVGLGARGLPPGLRLVNGRITGTPRRLGRYPVTITAGDRSGSLARERFTWTIAAATHLLAASLTGLGQERPALSFTLAAGQGAPHVRRMDISPPGELRLRSTRTIAVSTAGRRVRFTVGIAHGRLTLVLRHGYARLRVTLGPGAVQLASGRGSHGARLAVTAIGSDGATSFLRAGVARR
jgi:hypothetical protein